MVIISGVPIFRIFTVDPEEAAHNEPPLQDHRHLTFLEPQKFSSQKHKLSVSRSTLF